MCENFTSEWIISVLCDKNKYINISIYVKPATSSNNNGNSGDKLSGNRQKEY